MEGRTTSDLETMAAAYAGALTRYLQSGDEGALIGAYELGRSALNNGMGPLDLVALHESALDPAASPCVLPPESDPRRATAFLLEVLSPFEMTYRRFHEANAALRGINEALESESRRTARQIHDGAGQILFTLQLVLAELMATLPPRWKSDLDRALELADQLDQQLRSLSRDLYPVALDDLGLNAAVRHLLDGVSTRAGMRATLRSSLPDRLPGAVAICLYRGVHEAVTNVVRHASATAVDVTLDRVGDHLVCRVRDDGVGFRVGDAKRTGLGLLGIQERLKGLHGELKLTSTPGEGTSLVMSLPAAAWKACDEHQSSDR